MYESRWHLMPRKPALLYGKLRLAALAVMLVELMAWPPRPVCADEQGTPTPAPAVAPQAAAPSAATPAAPPPAAPTTPAAESESEPEEVEPPRPR